LDDFSGLAYGVKAFTCSDDLTNPTIPEKYKKASVYISKHCIIGTDSVIFPGVKLAEGTAIGAMTLVTKSTEPWSVYFGIPAKK